ncbi:MoaD/ThiS family protein [Leucobacter chromiiresistens]|uniref:Molybdopterin converting factor, small subunit n=1 Tax=Leucobacter chromiiresistens TaxID=1079994 RepID=A0A1H1BNL0_9MICO|nr:MoaD/ThiS family protein [Leucobacter chromiiresistens]SDQ53554.1 Molybdopterin converting factor, small subunit [Leucobacter chromiiresistens]
MARITVRYFAAAADAAGLEEEAWELDAPATLAALRAELVEQYGETMHRVIRSGSFLVDGTVRRDDGAITGDVVDVLPAFAGG